MSDYCWSIKNLKITEARLWSPKKSIISHENRVIWIDFHRIAWEKFLIYYRLFCLFLIGRYTIKTNCLINKYTNNWYFQVFRSITSTIIWWTCTCNNNYWWCWFNSSSRNILKMDIWNQQLDYVHLILQIYILCYHKKNH
jgi:hypothetical protein